MHISEEKPAPKSKEDLPRFELLVFRKKNLPHFRASNSNVMTFNTRNCEWAQDDSGSINELIRRFLKFYPHYVRAVIYDNLLSSSDREDRWIFKYDYGVVSLNRLHEYNAIIKEKYLKEIDAMPTK